MSTIAVSVTFEKVHSNFIIRGWQTLTRTEFGIFFWRNSCGFCKRF